MAGLARQIVFLILAIRVSDAMAANPSYVCNPAQDCREERSATHDIGRGATIALPKGWTYFSYPQAPIPEMAGLREIRAFKGAVLIAITPLPNVNRQALSEAALRAVHAKATARYADQSKEKASRFVSMSHGDLVGGHASFTAMNDGDRPFAVVPNRTYASVTSFVISYKFVLFSISVASERAPDEDYRQAVKAVQSIK
jgi:hypothetical protein